MKLNELFLEQLDAETKSTRRALERVPEGRNDWKPHEKSMPLGYLSALVAKMPGWIAMMINLDEYDLNTKDATRTTITCSGTRLAFPSCLSTCSFEIRAIDYHPD